MRRSVTNAPRFFRPTLLTLTLLAGLQGYSVSALAEKADTGESTLALGFGVMSEKTPYTGRSRETEVLPLVKYENEYFELMGPAIALKLPSLDISDSHQLKFSIVGEYDGSGYEDDDADILDGMDERKSGFWAGGRVVWTADVFDVSAEWLGDVSGNSKGQRFGLGLERNWHVGDDIMITPRLGATWYDKKYVDYYYGVENDEVRVDRAAYKGKSVVNAEVGVRGLYLFDNTHSVFLDIEASTLGSGIKDSPLVDRSTTNNVTFGYLYQF